MSREMHIILITWEAERDGRRVGGTWRQEGYDVADGQRRFGQAFRHSRIVTAVDAGPVPVAVAVPAVAPAGPAAVTAGSSGGGSLVPTVLLPKAAAGAVQGWPQPCRGCGITLEKMDAISAIPQGNGQPLLPGPWCYDCMVGRLNGGQV